jgi:tagaturonate epimerase
MVMELPKYTVGIGDRFGRQGKAQLAAFIKARELGVNIAPVWNKSNREHTLVHTEPSSVRAEADAATKALQWNAPYFVDADHIGLKTVDGFIPHSDFFTIDVADFIGKPADNGAIQAFVASQAKRIGTLNIDGIAEPLEITAARIDQIARKYLYAVQEAGKVYRHIEAAKGKGNFITEISMDETDQPQRPFEILVILAAIAHEKIPVQTIAPKFTGRFNKGVDYVGDVAAFEKELNDDVSVIAYAVKEFGLPASLKLSVHSGSDKFSIYPALKRLVKKRGAGLHIKTAGTTWLEEIIGLASAGGEGLQIAKDIYAQALARFDALVAPYATVIDIKKETLPSAETVNQWGAEQFASTVRHDQSNPQYNPQIRQLLHVAFKLAYEFGDRFRNAQEKYEPIIAKNVTENLFDRHIKRLFINGE